MAQPGTGLLGYRGQLPRPMEANAPPAELGPRHAQLAYRRSERGHLRPGAKVRHLPPEMLKVRDQALQSAMLHYQPAHLHPMPTKALTTFITRLSNASYAPPQRTGATGSPLRAVWRATPYLRHYSFFFPNISAKTVLRHFLNSLPDLPAHCSLIFRPAARIFSV